MLDSSVTLLVLADYDATAVKAACNAALKHYNDLIDKELEQLISVLMERPRKLFWSRKVVFLTREQAIKKLQQYNRDEWYHLSDWDRIKSRYADQIRDITRVLRVAISADVGQVKLSDSAVSLIYKWL